MKIPEDLFWYADIPFLESIIENQAAFDGWLRCEIEKEKERALG